MIQVGALIDASGPKLSTQLVAGAVPPVAVLESMRRLHIDKHLYISRDGPDLALGLLDHGFKLSWAYRIV